MLDIEFELQQLKDESYVLKIPKNVTPETLDKTEPRIDLSTIPNPTPKGIIELKRLQAAVRKGVYPDYIINRKIIDEMYGIKCVSVSNLL